MTQPDTPAAVSHPLVTDIADVLDRCQWPLYTFLRGIAGDDEQARDLVQDTFCEAWRAAQRGTAPFDVDRPEAEVRRWLFRVAYTRAISALRRRRVIRWQSLDDPRTTPRGALPAPPFEQDVAERAAMSAALAALSSADAACLLLIVVHGFTAAEVSQIVRASPQAVAKRFARAKLRLRAAYLAQNDQPPEASHHEH
jgi:RNA polymerase sigma factor (sigma-70 family)